MLVIYLNFACIGYSFHRPAFFIAESAAKNRREAVFLTPARFHKTYRSLIHNTLNRKIRYMFLNLKFYYVIMVGMSNEDAKRNSEFLMQKALARRNSLCSPEVYVQIQAGQTTQRQIMKDPVFATEPPKLKIERPKICKIK